MLGTKGQVVKCSNYGCLLSSPQYTSMWFIGLEFKKTPGAVNIEITFEIQAFINAGL